MTDYRHTSGECDIIMKGGITSGVVYPKTILRLAMQKRFRCIGGTSAGAIAAVMTAAAEYNRAGGGFDAIAGLPSELQHKLLALFQPYPQFKPLFDAALRFSRGEKARAAFGLLMANAGLWRKEALIGLAVGLTPLLFGDRLAAALLVVILVAVSVARGAVQIVRNALRDLQGADFGMCPGPTQPYAKAADSVPGLIDWLAEKIELAAGRMTEGGPKPERPLLFEDVWAGRDGAGDAKRRVVDLRMMTTNLSVRRPHTLPDLDAEADPGSLHYFSEAKFRLIFPGWVVDYLVADAQTISGPDVDWMKTQGYLPMPTKGRMPLVVAARMSLSFPILFTTVPLHRVRKVGDARDVEHMLFSDGGLSSNFPIHFFDALLPGRPTFGVSLESVDEKMPDRRVHLPFSDEVHLNSTPIQDLFGFLGRLVDAAKDWQDRLQSTLPGYRERIVSIYLKDNEGGLNLDMPAPIIESLVGLGDRAGALATGASLDPADEHVFDFDEHRWRRFLVAFAAAEDVLMKAAWSWKASGCGTRDFIARYKDAARSFRGETPDEHAWREQVFQRFDGLMAHVDAWPDALAEAKDAQVPQPRTRVRLSPTY